MSKFVNVLFQIPLGEVFTALELGRRKAFWSRFYEKHILPPLLLLRGWSPTVLDNDPLTPGLVGRPVNDRTTSAKCDSTKFHTI